jgi:hypothetical protein
MKGTSVIFCADCLYSAAEVVMVATEGSTSSSSFGFLLFVDRVTKLLLSLCKESAVVFLFKCHVYQ